MVERRTVEEGIAKPEQARELAIQRLKMKQDFKGIAAGGALVVAVCFLIWLLADVDLPWPVWVAIGVAILLVVQGWKAYGSSNQITEADVQREIERG
ncbi:MAG TPA: 2TM domain-containing protein [Solirubrobacterales bacterium]|nr:2TM domain-containing protein [Solirubrobacterales bacterium]